MHRRQALVGMGAAATALAVPGARARAASMDPLPRTKDYIVALVRSHPGIDPRSRAVQKIEPVVMRTEAKAPVENPPVFDHFVGDLHLRYVFDDPRFTPFLHGQDLKRLGLDRDELPALVVTNFRRLYPKVAVARPERWLGLVVNGGELEPCVMLDGVFWEEQTKVFGGELIAVVPSFTEVYFTPREPKANVELLKQLASRQHEKAGKRAVSRTVFLRRNFRWEVFA